MIIEVPVELPLVKGLTTSLEQRVGLRRCLGVYPKDDKLMPLKGLTELYDASESWPWPQLFKLAEQLYVCYQTTISVLRPDGLEVLLDGIDSRGYPWGAAVIGKFPVFVNNRVVVHPDEVTLLQSREEDRHFLTLEAQTGTFPACRDVCNFNGQFVVAAPWMYGVFHRNHVAWARPGTIDFEWSHKTSANMMYVEGVGDMLRVVETDRGVIAYGTEGVAELRAIEHPFDFGQQLISRVGLYSQLAVTKGDGFHAYVGTDYRLHYITNDVKHVGYDYIFETATGEISLSYDHKEKLVYASL
jgi:hypothetical protein